MKALSCAIVLLTCVLAEVSIMYEEVHTGKDLRRVAIVIIFGIALIEWFTQVRRKDSP
jgi:small basic protein